MVMSIHGVSLFYVTTGFHWLCFARTMMCTLFDQSFLGLDSHSYFHGVLVDLQYLSYFLCWAGWLRG